MKSLILTFVKKIIKKTYLINISIRSSLTFLNMNLITDSNNSILGFKNNKKIMKIYILVVFVVFLLYDKEEGRFNLELSKTSTINEQKQGSGNGPVKVYNLTVPKPIVPYNPTEKKELFKTF